jgi:hypothetical protein
MLAFITHVPKTEFDTTLAKCQAGTYHCSSGACLECPTGTWSSLGQKACKSCPAGQYTTTHLSCLDCPAGQYSSKNSDECQKCGVGKVSKQKSSVCTSCPAGKRADHFLNRCVACLAGTYSNSSADSCTRCDWGQYSPAKSPRCTDCSPSFYSSYPSEKCEKCSKGSYSTAKMWACTYCTPFLLANSAQTGCLPKSDCKAGTYKDVTDNTCKRCPINQYSIDGAFGCDYCQWITFPNADQSACIGPTRPPTPRPTHPPTPRPTPSSDCKAGTYKDVWDGTCKTCPLLTYSFANWFECKTCDFDLTPNADQTDCVARPPSLAPTPLPPNDCKAGTYKDVKDNTCKQCFSNEYSFAGWYECKLCDWYFVPNADQTDCIARTRPPTPRPSRTPTALSDCTAGTYKDVTDGACKKCPLSQYSFAGWYTCKYCDFVLQPNADQTDCVGPTRPSPPTSSPVSLME